MRKGIFGAVVIMLAGTCWVVAQNASSNRPSSPYGAPVSAAPKAAWSDDRILQIGNEPVVIPTTELDIPGIPPAPSMPIPTFKADPSMTIPMPTLRVAPPAPIAPPVYKIPDAPIELPPNNIERSLPLTLPSPSIELPMTNNNISPAPISAPGYSTNNNISPAPISAPGYSTHSLPVDEKSPARSITTPAVSGLPALPAVPGVPSLPPGVPNYASPGSGGLLIGNVQLPPPNPSIGGPMIGDFQLPPPNPSVDGPTKLQPPPQGPYPADPRWSVDDPGNWQSRPRWRDGLSDPSRERILGPRIWGGAEYLAWFVQTQGTPPLVQNVVGVAPGATSFTGAQIVNLFPDHSVNYDILSGVRGTIGFWLNGTQTFGFEMNYLWFGHASDGDVFPSASNAILGRPFLNTKTGRADLFQTSDLNGTKGTIRAYSGFHVEGGEANFLLNSPSVGPNLNFIGGFRYLQITEQLDLQQFSENDAVNVSAHSYDKFGTHNNFFGGQMGGRWAFDRGRFFGSITGKIAFGAMNESVNIAGGTIVNTPTRILNANGGVLAQTTNIGTYSRLATAFIPEATATIGYRFAPWAAGFVGYNFMYVSEVVRPGKQIDPMVNPANFPFSGGSATASHPSFQMRGESLWLQGINFGLKLQY